MKRYWACVIGPIDSEKIPFGGDFPPRQAAQDAMIKMTGVPNFVCSSGWLTEGQDVEETLVKWGKIRNPEG